MGRGGCHLLLLQVRLLAAAPGLMYGGRRESNHGTRNDPEAKQGRRCSFFRWTGWSVWVGGCWAN